LQLRKIATCSLFSSIVQELTHILVPTDFSPAAWKATLHAADLCSIYEAGMTLLHVIPAMSHSDSNFNHEIEKKMDTLATTLKSDKNLARLTPIIREGAVAKEVIIFLQANEIDLIVVGLNGNGGLNNKLGRNCQHIIQQAGIPVIVLPSK